MSLEEAEKILGVSSKMDYAEVLQVRMACHAIVPVQLYIHAVFSAYLQRRALL